MEIGIYCYFIGGIVTKVIFWKCLLSGPVPNMYFLSKPLSLIGCLNCHGNQKAQFEKYKKISSSEAIWGLKLCRNVHSIGFYENVVFYCCCTLVAMAT